MDHGHVPLEKLIETKQIYGLSPASRRRRPSNRDRDLLRYACLASTQPRRTDGDTHSAGRGRKSRFRTNEANSRALCAIKVACLAME